MRQKKSFFTKNNSLDRVGGIPTEKKDSNSEEMLLDSKTLSDFERISPGFSDKLFDIARNEQKHLQKMDDVKASISNNAIRMGRISFVFIFIAICYFTYDLILNNIITEALIFASISFGTLLMLNCKKNRNCKVVEEAQSSSKHPYQKNPQRRRYYKRK